MNIDTIEQEFRTEILSNPKEYPNLYRLEISKNRFNYFKAKFESNGGVFDGY
jgi:hypothetical protein